MVRKAIIDVDALIYSIGFVGEKRKISVVNIGTGDTFEYDNRTEFWGRGKKIGGELAKMNAANGTEYTKEDFEISDIQQVVEPIQNVLHSAKATFERMVEVSQCKAYQGYLGGRENFRVERSTIIKYKGNRDNVLRPLLKDELVEYYIKHKGVLVVNTGIETDDQCVIDCYKNDNVTIGVDKDYYGCPINFLNTNRVDEGISNGDCFGKLWLDNKKGVRGFGRLFFYWQVANGDDSDNYFANSAALETKWADMSAYNALKDARNDAEALRALKNVYTTLYPTQKEIIGWRGDTLTVDWLYVLRENWDLARMLRTPDDTSVDARNVLDKFGLL